jgi:hypothetical protein
MVGGSDRHAATLDELVEWWEDLTRQQINSSAVLLPVPPRWGRTHLLNEFAAIVDEGDAVNIVVRIPGAALPDGLGVQALRLRQLFSEARVEHRIAELLGADRLGGATQLSLAVASLFFSPLATLVGMLVAGIGVGAASKVWDDSLAGQEGMLAKLARAVAAVSVSVPVIVIIDDADRLELDLAVILVENLIGRIDGRVLVVAAINPDGKLQSALTSRTTCGLTEGRVQTVDTDPGMDYQARVDLAAELCPDLPAVAAHRIGQRTQNFAEVFAVTSSEHLTELDVSGEDAIVEATDDVINAQVDRVPPSRQAVVLAWAGGILHARQAKCAREVLEYQQPTDDNADDKDVIRFESLVRLADPASPRLAEKVRGLATSKRRRLAETVFDTALEIGRDPLAGPVEKVVAWKVVHEKRADLQDRIELVGVQCQLVHGLEALGDPAAAYGVAAAALTDYRARQPDRQQTPEHNDLSAAVLRLRTLQPRHDDPLIEATVAAAAEGGAAVGLEARVWAAVDLLGQRDQREQALELTDRITAELSGRSDLGAIGNRWRLQLAFHTGRAGYPAIAQHLLAPMLTESASPDNEDAARAVLDAVGGPGADTRLQIIGLEAELAALPTDADDDRLRVHHALAADYYDLGDCQRALRHAQQELPLRRRIQGNYHPLTLNTRSSIATWTGEGGNPAEALRQSQELLPDQEQVLGPNHPFTLSTRSNIAFWTGQNGNPAEALRQFEELLPHVQRVLGRNDPLTLNTRHNVAVWTAETGHPGEALRLFQELLPDRERALGPDHRDTLTTRYSIAVCTGQSGHPGEALRLFQELLPDRERVLGPDHPDTLSTRYDAARWAGENGQLTEALRLSQELLPDQERVFGPDHPHTLVARSNIAFWTGRSGHPAEALRLFQELLPDQERVFGRDHPDTLSTRNNIAGFTAERGHPAEALRLFQELLPDQERVLGPDHPNTLAARINVAGLTAKCGHPAEALQLFQELLPDVRRVLGRDHPLTLTTRDFIGGLTRPGSGLGEGMA